MGFSQPIESIIVNGMGISKGSKIYYARVLPSVGVCYVQTMTIRTVYEDLFVAIDELTKNAQVINNNCIGTYVFDSLKKANNVVKEFEKSGKIREFKNEERFKDEY